MTKSLKVDRKRKNIIGALMNPSLPDPVPWTSNDLKDILVHLLRTPFYSEKDDFIKLDKWQEEQIISILKKYGKQTFGDLFQNEEISIDALKLLKDYVKQILIADKEMPRDVTRVVYICTILRCHQMGDFSVTKLDNTSIKREARRCLTFTWLPDEIRKLLRSCDN